MRFSKISAPTQRLIRTFLFLSGNRAGTQFNVQLEYIPPETLNAQLEQEQVRIVGRRQYGTPEDLKESQIATRTAWHMILASRVQKIVGLTPRKLWELTSMNPTELATMGVDEAIELDPSNTTEISDEHRAKWGSTPETKTIGQEAAQNIFWLVNEVAELRTFLETILKDVSYFQDKEWEKQLKN